MPLAGVSWWPHRRVTLLSSRLYPTTAAIAWHWFEISDGRSPRAICRAPSHGCLGRRPIRFATIPPGNRDADGTPLSGPLPGSMDGAGSNSPPRERTIPIQQRSLHVGQALKLRPSWRSAMTPPPEHTRGMNPRIMAVTGKTRICARRNGPGLQVRSLSPYPLSYGRMEVVECSTEAGYTGRPP